MSVIWSTIAFARLSFGMLSQKVGVWAKRPVNEFTVKSRREKSRLLIRFFIYSIISFAEFAAIAPSLVAVTI